MYTPQAHPCRFTHVLRLEKLPLRFQGLVHDWSRNLPSEEHLHYMDGEFYMAVPFEMLTADAISLAELEAFTRRFNRIQTIDNAEAMQAHIASYPFKNWMNHGEELDYYIEMMFMLHHLKAKLAPELVKPATLAIFVHE